MNELNAMIYKDFFINLNKLISKLPKERRFQFLKLLALMIAASAAEAVSIGAVLPFLGVLINPNALFQNDKTSTLIDLLGIANPDDLTLVASVVFGSSAIISGGIRICLLKYTLSISFATGADLSNLVYRKSLYQPYDLHLRTHSSEIISGLSTKINNVIYMIILPCLNFISSAVVVLIIFCTLVYINSTVAMFAAILFGGLYFLISLLTRVRNRRNSKMIADGSTALIKIMQDGIGGIRHIILNGTQEENCRKYSSTDRILRNAQENNAFISTFPRYAIESLGIFMICVFAYGLTRVSGNAQDLVPTLGALALGAQRILPSMQQAYAAYSTIVGGSDTLKDVILLTDQQSHEQHEKTIGTELNFKKYLELRDISYYYPENKHATIRGISMKVNKNKSIGIIGATGSGKSTLLDLISGLLIPTSGTIFVDDIPLTKEHIHLWRQRVAHVPQRTFLTDATVAENIALGIKKEHIDMAQVKVAAELASIASDIEKWPHGYFTRVGEHGALLSGGQRQRISIARALYKRADFIVLDEATSAMDPETESSLTLALKNIGVNATMILVAHRLSTLSICDAIIELQDGVIKGVFSYDQIVSRGSKN